MATSKAPALELTSSSTVDLAGRTESITDEPRRLAGAEMDDPGFGDHPEGGSVVRRRSHQTGRTTIWAYTNGGRPVTETGPGGVTRITETYLDGRTKSVTGTGVIPEFHDYDIDQDANCPLPLVDDLRDGFAPNEPLIAAKQCVHTVYYGTGDQRDAGPGWRCLHVSATLPRKGSTKCPWRRRHLGRMIRQGTDLSKTGTLTLAGIDPVSETERYFEEDNNDWFEVSVSRRYLIDNNDQDVAESTSRRQLGTGAQSYHETTGPDGNTRTSTTVIDRPNRRVTTTASTSLSTLDAVSISFNGQLISQTSHSVAEPVLYAYDQRDAGPRWRCVVVSATLPPEGHHKMPVAASPPMGRVTAVTDPRTQQDSVTVYNAIGQVVTTTTTEVIKNDEAARADWREPRQMARENTCQEHMPGKVSSAGKKCLPGESVGKVTKLG